MGSSGVLQFSQQISWSKIVFYGCTQSIQFGETVFLSHLDCFCLICMLRFPHLESNETFFITMAFYGYARVSTNDQDLDLQIQTLRAAGCEIIRSEKASGTSRDGRTELQLLLDFLRKGDRHCCKVSDEAAFCLIQRPYISKTLLTRRISPRGSP